MSDSDNKTSANGSVKDAATLENEMKEKELYVTIWAKAVETQMHFNEMSVKSRQFGLAFVAAALGLAIVLLSQDKEFSITVPICSGFELHATVLIVLASAFALYCVRILDLNVYHRMLRGAVTFGEDFEERYMKKIFSLQKGMTQSISHFSRMDDASTTRAPDGTLLYTGNKKVSAEDKIKSFYNFSIAVLIGTAALMFVLTAKLEPRKSDLPARDANTTTDSKTGN